MRALWLALALVPYAALAGFDAWLHEKSRQVPLVEKWLHGGLALCLIVFVGAAFRAERTLAFLALGLLVPLAAYDEIGFHGTLAMRERRVHFASYAALGVFVSAWLWLGSGP
jgi:hypothetical protein